MNFPENLTASDLATLIIAVTGAVAVIISLLKARGEVKNTAADTASKLIDSATNFSSTLMERLEKVEKELDALKLRVAELEAINEQLERTKGCLEKEIERLKEELKEKLQEEPQEKQAP